VSREVDSYPFVAEFLYLAPKPSFPQSPSHSRYQQTIILRILEQGMNFDSVDTALEMLAGYEKVEVGLPLPEEIPGLKKAYFAKKKDDSIRYGGLLPLTRRPPPPETLQHVLLPLSQERLAAAFTLQSRP
jgi:hypothetical protein